MSLLTRHQMGAALVDALRKERLGVRDLFEGRQEPLSWFFRGVAYDQSELDIMESGAVDTLHAPSALVELAVDEMALALANVGVGGVAAYLRAPAGEGGVAAADPDALELDPSALLGVVTVEVAPPALWLDERAAAPEANEELADRLSAMAESVGTRTDAVEVHIEGAVSAEEGWSGVPGRVQPSGVSVTFTLEIPLVGVDERELGQACSRAARTASEALEGIRSVFRESPAG